MKMLLFTWFAFDKPNEMIDDEVKKMVLSICYKMDKDIDIYYITHKNLGMHYELVDGTDFEYFEVYSFICIVVYDGDLSEGYNDFVDLLNMYCAIGDISEEWHDFEAF